VEIELEKQAYILHEPIWLDVTLTNITSDTLRTHSIVFTSPNHGSFQIEIRDNNGNLLEYTGPMDAIANVPGNLLLDAGEQDFGSINLLEYFRSQNKNSGYSVINWSFPFIPKGSYTINVYFEGDISNNLSFDIVEPSGKEKEVLEIIEKASKISPKLKADSFAKIFNEVVNKYPNSVFAEKCFYLSEAYSHMDEFRLGSFDLKNLHREILMKYPNSSNSLITILSITHGLDDSQKLEILNKYIEDYTNTRCSKFAKQMKERILKKKDGE